MCSYIIPYYNTIHPYCAHLPSLLRHPPSLLCPPAFPAVPNSLSCCAHLPSLLRPPAFPAAPTRLSCCARLPSLLRPPTFPSASYPFPAAFACLALLHHRPTLSLLYHAVSRFFLVHSTYPVIGTTPDFFKVFSGNGFVKSNSIRSITSVSGLDGYSHT